ncbi:unnamed protein product, partial [Pylaiella littoralis]
LADRESSYHWLPRRQYRAHAALCCTAVQTAAVVCYTAVLRYYPAVSVRTVVACLLEHGVSSCCRSVERTTTTMSRKRTCRVLDGITVEFRLSQLNGILQRTVETMRGDDVIQGKKAMAILQNWCGENCSFEKVFGSVRGMLPATAPG